MRIYKGMLFYDGSYTDECQWVKYDAVKHLLHHEPPAEVTICEHSVSPASDCKICRGKHWLSIRPAEPPAGHEWETVDGEPLHCATCRCHEAKFGGTCSFCGQPHHPGITCQDRRGRRAVNRGAEHE